MIEEDRLAARKKDWLIDLTSKLQIGKDYVSKELGKEMKALRDKISAEIKQMENIT